MQTLAKTTNGVSKPSDHFRTDIFVDTFGFSPLGLRAAIDTCGIDRILFGTDFGPVPYGVREQAGIVAEMVATEDDRDKVYWRNSEAIFALGLEALTLSPV